jgi:hypothetical protein
MKTVEQLIHAGLLVVVALAAAVASAARRSRPEGMPWFVFGRFGAAAVLRGESDALQHQPQSALGQHPSSAAFRRND